MRASLGESPIGSVASRLLAVSASSGTSSRGRLRGFPAEAAISLYVATKSSKDWARLDDSRDFAGVSLVGFSRLLFVVVSYLAGCVCSFERARDSDALGGRPFLAPWDSSLGHLGCSRDEHREGLDGCRGSGSSRLCVSGRGEVGMKLGEGCSRSSGAQVPLATCWECTP